MKQFLYNRKFRSLLNKTQILGNRVRMPIAKFYNNLFFKKEYLARVKSLNHIKFIECNNEEQRYSVKDGYGEIYLDENLKKNLINISNKIINLGQRSNNNKDFMANYLSDNLLLENKEIFLDFITNPSILSAATNYLGYIPVLNSIKILKSEIKKKNQNNYSSSQLYHLDQSDKPLFKIIFLISDTYEKNGPFTFIKKKSSQQIQNKVKSGILKSDLVKDHVIEKYLDEKDEVKVIGKKGTCIYVDSSQCFHRGSRNNIEERRIIIMSYLSPIRTDFRDFKDYKSIFRLQDDDHKSWIFDYKKI